MVTATALVVLAGFNDARIGAGANQIAPRHSFGNAFADEVANDRKIDYILSFTPSTTRRPQ